MVQSSRPSIQIDLNEFKLHLYLKNRTKLTLHFDSPSRRFYLSVIALVVCEMKKLEKIKSIPLQGHLDLLALLNESIGGAAGSSDQENLLHRIYRKWKDALPNLEEAPLFKVLGKKKGEGDGAIGKIYSFTDTEKDDWANLFEYMGSNENVRLKFAIDKIGVGLNETSIIFEDFRNGDAWDEFISSLKTVASVDRMKYPLPDEPSIAVLPFVNMSEDPKQEYFSDGITEDLITDLSKISGLMVIARNSTFPYKGKPVKIKQVAEELGVRYILEGSIQKAGEEIRINAQLVDAITGVHLWAERYDGTRSKVFALQDRVTQKIVSALVVKLTGSEKQVLAEKGTNKVEAYDEFLRGWIYYLRMTPSDLTTAVQSFKKAIELDPNYGRAYAALALAYYMGSWQSGMYKGLEAAGVARLEARLRARQYLKQAMKSPISIAHHVNGLFYLFRRQHEEAVSELERALALDPNDPSCNSEMGTVLYFNGKPKEAVDFQNRALRLDPHNPAFYLGRLGTAQFCIGNLEEAASLLEKAGRLNPENRGRFSWLATIYGLLGREKEARLSLDNWGKAAELNLPLNMYSFPFKDRAVADRFAQGLIKAGIKAPSWGYFPTFKENQLTGEEIKRLLFGSKTTGLSYPQGQQWWIEPKKNGGFTWRGPCRIESRGGFTIVGPSSDNGKSWVEGDLICSQYQKRYWGLENCGTVFRNPEGTYEGKDEYFICWDTGISPLSVAR